jgi:hypothetical protein
MDAAPSRFPRGLHGKVPETRSTRFDNYAAADCKGAGKPMFPALKLTGVTNLQQ